MFHISYYLGWIIFSIGLLIYLYVLYRKTVHPYYKSYILAILCGILALIPFVIVILEKWKPRTLESLLAGLISLVFFSLFLYLAMKAYKLEKSSFRQDVS